MVDKFRAVIADASIFAMSNAEEKDRHGKLTKRKLGRRRPRDPQAPGVDSWRIERSTPGFYGPKHVAGHIKRVIPQP